MTDDAAAADALRKGRGRPPRVNHLRLPFGSGGDKMQVASPSPIVFTKRPELALTSIGPRHTSSCRVSE